MNAPTVLSMNGEKAQEAVDLLRRAVTLVKENPWAYDERSVVIHKNFEGKLENARLEAFVLAAAGLRLECPLMSEHLPEDLLRRLSKDSDGRPLKWYPFGEVVAALLGGTIPDFQSLFAFSHWPSHYRLSYHDAEAKNDSYGRVEVLDARVEEFIAQMWPALQMAA